VPVDAAVSAVRVFPKQSLKPLPVLVAVFVDSTRQFIHFHAEQPGQLLQLNIFRQVMSGGRVEQPQVRLHAP
jgi:hypothetical protein